jgi:hypothetical protein
MGVRFLDLRLCKYRNDQDSDKIIYYTLHTFLTVPLEDVIRDICIFMNENPTEAVLLSLKSGHWLVDVEKEKRASKCEKKDIPEVIEFIDQIF